MPMIAEVRITGSTRTVTGACVADIARTQFGHGVTIRPERHGVWAVVATLGAHGTGVIGRIRPIGRTA